MMDEEFWVSVGDLDVNSETIPLLQETLKWKLVAGETQVTSRCHQG